MRPVAVNDFCAEFEGGPVNLMHIEAAPGPNEVLWQPPIEVLWQPPIEVLWQPPIHVPNEVLWQPPIHVPAPAQLLTSPEQVLPPQFPAQPTHCSFIQL